MATGIPLSSECKHVFDQIWRLKQHRYAIFRIENERRIRVEWLGVREAGYEEFLADLCRAGPDQCRYAVYDYAYRQQYQGTTGTRLREKLFLMLWCPSQAQIKDKMLYSSTFAVLKQEFVGVGKCIQATELDDIHRDRVENELCWDRED
ncbi:cofilin/actin-depolymerizing factor homolog [Drosophila kikkawai]|uniref:Cofilin/actin-depolymerizing factor homolog n=1 Tax=Drosophila kikkawai TaxID=30033 RepID=A0A6P4JGP3_DROKI|nr:cofilin/actin-depolymerizing factor homolog [Drosophila kikkawai]KAH8345224.1 hypothetical protein KR059_010831 [Drosophila kikkawai]